MDNDPTKKRTRLLFDEPANIKIKKIFKQKLKLLLNPLFSITMGHLNFLEPPMTLWMLSKNLNMIKIWRVEKKLFQMHKKIIMNFSWTIFDCYKQSLTQLWLPPIHPIHPSFQQNIQTFRSNIQKKQLKHSQNFQLFN